MKDHVVRTKVISYDIWLNRLEVEPCDFGNGKKVRFIGNCSKFRNPGEYVGVYLHAGIIPRVTDLPKYEYIFTHTPEELHNIAGELIILGYEDHGNPDWYEMIKFDINSGCYKNAIAIQINTVDKVILPVHIDYKTVKQTSIFETFEAFKM